MSKMDFYKKIWWEQDSMQDHCYDPLQNNLQAQLYSDQQSQIICSSEVEGIKIPKIASQNSIILDQNIMESVSNYSNNKIYPARTQQSIYTQQNYASNIATGLIIKKNQIDQEMDPDQRQSQSKDALSKGQDQEKITQNQEQLNDQMKKKKKATLTLQKSRRIRKRINKRKEKSKQKRKYTPTKNILQNFKKSNLNAIYNYLGKTYKNKILKNWKQAKNMSMDLYDRLYNDQELREPLRIYFRSRQIYKDLFTSRVGRQTKLIYLKKIPIFYENFINRRFKHINE